VNTLGFLLNKERRRMRGGGNILAYALKADDVNGKTKHLMLIILTLCLYCCLKIRSCPSCISDCKDFPQNTRVMMRRRRT